MFELYFHLGIDHILDINGIDHLLFIISLCAVYQWKDFKKILILITAFTLGHSLTLALSTLQILVVSKDLVEFFIPFTILLSALANLVWADKVKSSKWSFHYLLASLFGLIHGLGFSNYLKSLLGREENIISPLFAFNVGLELGQVFIVAGYLLISALILQLNKRLVAHWPLIISSIVFGMALLLLKDSLLNS